MCVSVCESECVCDSQWRLFGVGQFMFVKVNLVRSPEAFNINTAPKSYLH